jgi:hypothetical protein
MHKTNSSVVLKWMVLMSLAQGVFISYFFVFVNALFIKEIGTSLLPHAYILSGIGGFCITFLFNYLEKVWGFIKSSIAFCVLFAIVMFGIWYFYIHQIFLYQLIFFAYAWFWISINFTTLIFWKLPSNLFNISENKKYNGVISSGEVISAIVAYLSIPALLHHQLITRDKLLLISFIGILIFSAITFILGLQIKKTESPIPLQTTSDQITSKSLFKEKFFQLIFISVFLGVIVQLLIDYSLMEVSAYQFSEPEELAKYFAFLFGGMRLFELILKSILTKYLVKEFGVFISLVSIVFALSFLIIIGLSSIISGYLGLIIIVSSLSKVFERAIYRSVYAPTINILYQAYPKTKRAITQNFADGIGKTIGQIVAAFIILWIGYMNSFESKVFTLFVSSLGILMVWYFVSKHLIYEYKSKLQEMVRKLPRLKENDQKPATTENYEFYRGLNYKVLYQKLMDIENNFDPSNNKFNDSSYVADNRNSLSIAEAFYHQLKTLDKFELNRFKNSLKTSLNENSNQLITLIGLMVDILLLQKDPSFSFYTFNKKLKSKHFLTSACIQNFNNASAEMVTQKDHYFLLEERLYKYTYLLACKRDLTKTTSLINQLIDFEIVSTKNDLIFLLGFKHDSLLVGEIYNMMNQNDKTQELIALELMELILKNQQKKWIMTIFREESPENVLSKLQGDFPQVILGKEKRLLSIIGNFGIDMPPSLRNQALLELVSSYPKEEYFDLCIPFTNDIHLNKNLKDFNRQEQIADLIHNDLETKQIQNLLKKHSHSNPMKTMSSQMFFLHQSNSHEDPSILSKDSKTIPSYFYDLIFPMEKSYG